MSTTLDTTLRPSQPAMTLSLGRVAVFAYGVTCYALGVSGLLYLILVTLGVVPLGLGAAPIAGTAAKLAVNVGLVALFGVQHAIMARQGFKQRFTQVIPAAAERSTFVLLSGLILASILFFWQPLEGSLWSVGAGVGRMALLGGCALGWSYMLAASFAIDHFELFGLKQVWRNLRGLDTQEPKLVQRLMYKFDRHPLMSGILLGLWCTPDMTATRFALAAIFTGYIVLGVAIEERDLVRRHGQRYVDFASRVGTIVPRLASYR
ncbi:MAG: hypothetical protein H6828_06375 [Planctomycetes bacterium]|nr:hypothetical protein [Planctomycetota bacterium]